MSKPKIIFFDIDGTLIEKKKSITPKMLETLHALQDNGIMICIASGRPPVQLPKLDVDFDAYLTFNGSYCYNDQDIVFDNPLRQGDVLQMIQNAQKINRPLAVATKTRIAANGVDEDLKEYFAIGGTDLKVAPDFDVVVDQDTVYQIMVGCREKDYDRLVADTQNAKVTAWWDRAADIIPATGSKGVAIEKVLDYYQIPVSEAIAFGDGGNDIEMLKTVGHGVAMGNATDDVKEIADDICGSVQDDGIFTYCKKHNLI